MVVLDKFLLTRKLHKRRNISAESVARDHAKGGEAMQGLFKALIYSLIAYAVCGCAAFDYASHRIAQQPPVSPRAETKAPSQNLPASEVCVLDPLAAAARETPSPTPSTGDAPIVQVPEPTYVLGNITSREFVHTFIIKNGGTSELKIKKVLPG